MRNEIGGQEVEASENHLIYQLMSETIRSEAERLSEALLLWVLLGRRHEAMPPTEDFRVAARSRTCLNTTIFHVRALDAAVGGT